MTLNQEKELELLIKRINKNSQSFFKNFVMNSCTTDEMDDALEIAETYNLLIKKIESFKEKKLQKICK